MSKSFQFASISHELRSAIANIAQLADQLSKSKQYDDALVNQIQLSSSFLLRVVESVIDEDRNLSIRNVKIDKILEEVMSIRAQNGIPLEVWVQPNVPRTLELCDIVVSRIIRNLIQNIDSHSGASRAHMDVSIDGNVLVISIRDNGNGISLDMRRRLFSPKSDSEVGHGIGLFLCALIAQKAGAELNCVNPEPGRCTFELRVPFVSNATITPSFTPISIAPDLSSEAQIQIDMLIQRFDLDVKQETVFPQFDWINQKLVLRMSESEVHYLQDYPYFSHFYALLNQKREIKPQGRHWLVVEDDPIVMQVTTLMMKSKGLLFSKAFSSEQCKSSVDDGIDVILMDVFLSGESGVELAQELRETGFNGLIVGMSAESKVLEDHSVFDLTILKPLSLASLNSLMKQIEAW